MFDHVHMADGKGDHIAVTARTNDVPYDFTNVIHRSFPSSLAADAPYRNDGVGR